MQVSQEEYAAFFKTTFKEFLDPAAHAHFNVEGTIEFSALLFVPGMAPFEEVSSQLPVEEKTPAAQQHPYRRGRTHYPLTSA